MDIDHSDRFATCAVSIASARNDRKALHVPTAWDDPLTDSRPIPSLIAHRGWASQWPENTLEALMEAVDAGARYVEFDVQLSADGVPVLNHDATLERTAGHPGCVMDMPWQELASIRVAEEARLGPLDGTFRVASLASVCDWLATEPDVAAFVEIKTESTARFGIDRVLGHCLELLAPLLDRCVVTSFGDDVVASARERADARIAWALERWEAASLARAVELSPDYLFCNYRKIPAATGELPRGAWQWALYEVKEADLALELAARGAQFIETMAIGDILSDPRLRPSGEVL
jgi:glycerophosphoryl diester phosphodiesterase